MNISFLALILAVVGVPVFVISSLVPLLMNGPNPASFRQRLRAWRIRRRHNHIVVERALSLMQDNPTLRLRCENWPRWKVLCGRCCAMSQADAEIQAERRETDTIIQRDLSS